MLPSINSNIDSIVIIVSAIAILLSIPVGMLVLSILTFKNPKYTKIDRISSVLNIFTTTLYIPMSLFSFFSMFVFKDTNSIIAVVLYTLWFYINISIPFISIASILLSITFKILGKHITGLIVQFLPLLIFGLNLLIYLLLDYVAV